MMVLPRGGWRIISGPRRGWGRLERGFWLVDDESERGRGRDVEMGLDGFGVLLVKYVE